MRRVKPGAILLLHEGHRTATDPDFHPALSRADAHRPNEFELPLHPASTGTAAASAGGK